MSKSLDHPDQPRKKKSVKTSSVKRTRHKKDLVDSNLSLSPQVDVSPVSDDAALKKALLSENDVFERNPLMEQQATHYLAGVYQIWMNWAYFDLTILSSHFQAFEPGRFIMPEQLTDSEETEYVYPILDFGNRLLTSKGSTMFSSGMSMCKLYYTIEKMIAILVERIKESGIEGEEVQVAFDGHLFAQRKAFESVINLNENVIVVNFQPEDWGDRYLQIVKNLSAKGYGYPSETPRDNYRQMARSSPKAKR